MQVTKSRRHGLLRQTPLRGMTDVIAAENTAGGRVCKREETLAANAEHLMKSRGEH